MGKVLSGTAKTIYSICITFAFILDAVLFVLLLLSALRTGHLGVFIAYLLLGTWLVPTIGHWLGMLLSAPFLIADVATQKETVKQSTNVARSNDLGEITHLSAPGYELIAFGFVSGNFPSQVWDGIFYLRTDLSNPTIRFQQQEVHGAQGVLGMQPPAWSDEVGGPSIDQLLPIHRLDWVRIESRADATQEPLDAHQEILSKSTDPNVLTGHYTVDGADRFFVFGGNLGTPFTPVTTWEQAFRRLGVNIIQ